MPAQCLLQQRRRRSLEMRGDLLEKRRVSQKHDIGQQVAAVVAKEVSQVVAREQLDWEFLQLHVVGTQADQPARNQRWEVILERAPLVEPYLSWVARRATTAWAR
jgi:hypothetical protein